ncbi:hypothetical protein HanPI659440_Chr17g0695111 [Helianthus annuus]|nr:hypothetical protein HanPI659440_Chr17g0695111 [Helianthus annuus]
MVFSVTVVTELIKSCSNAAMQVIAPFRLLFIHTVTVFRLNVVLYISFAFFFVFFCNELIIACKINLDI